MYPAEAKAGSAKGEAGDFLLAKSRELVRPASSGTGEADGAGRAALALAQMRAPEWRSVARLLRTTRERPDVAGGTARISREAIVAPATRGCSAMSVGAP